MEPALYSPEDLLGDERRKEQILSHRSQQQGSEAADEQQQPSSSSWFSHWFGLSDARTSTSGADARSQALHKPPFVRTHLPWANATEQTNRMVSASSLSSWMGI